MKLYNLGIQYEDFESDIFYLGENNEITFEEAIKNSMKRLSLLLHLDFGQYEMMNIILNHLK